MILQTHPDGDGLPHKPYGEELQAFFLPARLRIEQQYGKQVASPHTIILCNPNLGFAEANQFSSEWVDFYLDHGINIVMWNYRGYGKSTGTPSPGNIQRDIEVVFRFASDRTN